MKVLDGMIQRAKLELQLFSEMPDSKYLVDRAISLLVETAFTLRHRCGTGERLRFTQRSKLLTVRSSLCSTLPVFLFLRLKCLDCSFANDA